MLLCNSKPFRKIRHGCSACGGKYRMYRILTGILDHGIFNPLSQRNAWRLKNIFSLNIKAITRKTVFIDYIRFSKLPGFKGVGSLHRKQTYYLYNPYCCPHVAIVFGTDFGGWGESTTMLLLKINQYLCNRTTYECFVCFST